MGCAYANFGVHLYPSTSHLSSPMSTQGFMLRFLEHVGTECIAGAKREHTQIVDR